MPSDIVVNGQHLVLLGIQGNAGDKDGVASVTVPVEVPDLTTALTLNPSAVANAIGLSGLIICTGRPFGQLEHGRYQVAFQFEGFNQEVTYERARVQLSFKPDKGEAPLATHPSYKWIVENYGPLDQDGKFPETYVPKSDGSGSGYSQAQKAKTNPFFGWESWIKFSGTFTRRYACTVLPSDLWNNIGQLISYPPDASKLRIRRFRTRRWLKEAPDIDETGNAYVVLETYRLTGQTNGAESIIYAQAQLKDD